MLSSEYDMSAIPYRETQVLHSESAAKLILVKGGMGADDNTIKIGNNAPVPISIGSGLMSAEFQGQSYTFSLRLPANVSIDSPSTGSVTYHGHCIRSLGS